MVQRFRKSSRGFTARAANKWVDYPALSYWACSKQEFGSPCQVLGLTSDGTRMGKKDQLWTAITDTGRDISAWAPPAVRLSATRSEL